MIGTGRHIVAVPMVELLDGKYGRDVYGWTDRPTD